MVPKFKDCVTRIDHVPSGLVIYRCKFFSWVEMDQNAVIARNNAEDHFNRRYDEYLEAYRNAAH